MNKEDYVSFEVAKLLKEKGFNEPCFSQYTKTGSIWNCQAPENFNESEGCYSRPSLYEAQKWIRDKQDFHIEICKQSDGWYLYIYDISIETYITECTNSNSSYEEALNRGIKEALKLI